MTRWTRLSAALVALSLGLVASEAAFAQSVRPGDVYSRGGFYGSRIAYDNGYREGVKKGEKDWRDGKRSDYYDDKEFRKADKGFHKEYGNRFDYERTFREGYASGYRDAYGARVGRNYPYGDRRAIPRGSAEPGWGYPNRYPGGRGSPDRYPSYPGSYPGAYGAARDNGYNDGYKRGLDDGRDRDRYDPIGERDYRSADHGYNGRYGSRETYQNEYRAAFREGYDEGYRQGLGR